MTIIHSILQPYKKQKGRKSYIYTYDWIMFLNSLVQQSACFEQPTQFLFIYSLTL